MEETRKQLVSYLRQGPGVTQGARSRTQTQTQWLMRAFIWLEILTAEMMNYTALYSKLLSLLALLEQASWSS